MAWGYPKIKLLGAVLNVPHACVNGLIHDQAGFRFAMSDPKCETFL